MQAHQLWEGKRHRRQPPGSLDQAIPTLAAIPLAGHRKADGLKHLQVAPERPSAAPHFASQLIHAPAATHGKNEERTPLSDELIAARHDLTSLVLSRKYKNAGPQTRIGVFDIRGSLQTNRVTSPSRRVRGYRHYPLRISEGGGRDKEKT